MQRFCACLLWMAVTTPALAQPTVVGNWKRISYTIDHEGQKIETHAALLQQRPCAAKILFRIQADGNFRLDASQSGCDDKYRNIQEKLYSKTRWRVQGDRITTSATDFAVGHTYVFSVSGDRMTWTGTEGQGVIVYQRQ
jgi:hypothetical protein